jgi:hypothetical protein
MDGLDRAGQLGVVLFLLRRAGQVLADSLARHQAADPETRADTLLADPLPPSGVTDDTPWSSCAYDPAERSFSWRQVDVRSPRTGPRLAWREA